MPVIKLGVDDAGRGPVIGPMVLAGCLLDQETEDLLKKLGVKDSKQLTQARREYLEKIIKEKAIAYKVLFVSPEKIDSSKDQGTKLNELEAKMAARIINVLNDKKTKISVILDCPSTTISKWRDYLITKIHHLQNLEISCEYKADVNHVSVSAASVLAKCLRERKMAKLKEKYGDEIGSGYSSDPATQKFLSKYAEKYKDDGIFRKSWITWQNAVKALGQRTLNL
jgi:ribonuclease HII